MEKYSVFKIIEDSLYSMRYCNEKSDKFYELFDNWTDIEYLYLFFKKHESDLKSGFFNKKKVKNAVNRTKKDAKKLENKLIKIAKEGKYLIDNLDKYIKNYHFIFSSNNFCFRRYPSNCQICSLAFSNASLHPISLSKF